MRRDEVLAWLNQELDAASFRDHLPLGLQVIGASEVRRVAVAVSASLDVFQRAAAADAQMLIVHHGLFWDGESRVIGWLERRRLETLFAADLSLVAYHLPLDAHPTLGNNAILAGMLGVVEPTPFAEHRGHLIGRYGDLSVPEPVAAVAERLGHLLGSEPLLLPGGPDPAVRAGVVSGAGAGNIRDAASLGLDVLVTGEASEESPYLAHELGVSMIAAGHHATETVGVRALAGRLEQQFDLDTVFLGVENPV